MPVTEARVVMQAPGQGKATWAMGSLFERLVGADDTDGLFGVSLVTQPPGTATPFHLHSHEAEAFYLLDGTMKYRAGEELFELTAGCFMYLPRGIPHAFRITGKVNARFLGLTAPGGLMTLYDEVGVPARQRRLPSAEETPMAEEIARWTEVGPRYGLSVVGPPLPEED